MACAIATPPARAFAIPAWTEPVVEYFNVHLGHYFLTIDPEEMAAIEAGAAGPGWVRTGLAFEAYRHPLPMGTTCAFQPCGDLVSRFYGPGPNSHFYTANAAEADLLRLPGTGWNFERVEFTIPLSDASGGCAEGLVPVHRFYNGRWRENDSNHRFVADEGERQRMLDRGWTYEGVAFCAFAAGEVAMKSLRVAIDLHRKILPSAACEDEAINLGPCMAINNFAPPSKVLAYVQETPPGDFFERTGVRAPFNFVTASDAEDAVAGIFVQGMSYGMDTLFGIHVDSAHRRAGNLSSVNPLYQLRTTLDTQGWDARFFPFGPTENESEVRVSFVANVKSIEMRTAGSHAYGHPTLEFTDTRSGRNLYFTVLTYGTLAGTPGEYLAPDTATEKVIVGTAFRAGSPYIRSLGLPTLHTPPGFESPNPWGWGGRFEFRMDREEFARVLAAARTLQPSLSADPADYLLDNFHFNNEVYGEGSLGMNLADFTLELVRKP